MNKITFNNNTELEILINDIVESDLDAIVRDIIDLYNTNRATYFKETLYI